MQAETFYHIYNHANGSENLFRSDENYRFFLQRWGKYIAPIAETYAYCLMPNHIHALVKIKEASAILNLQGFQNLGGLNRGSNNEVDKTSIRTSKIISQHLSNLFNSYTKAYNKMYERRGSLFQPNFKRKEITSDAYLKQVIFYIHHNPVHHGFTKNIEEWPHSSYHAVLSNQLTKVKREEVQCWFGSKMEFKKFHEQAMKELKNWENDFAR